MGVSRKTIATAAVRSKALRRSKQLPSASAPAVRSLLWSASRSCRPLVAIRKLDDDNS